MPNTSRRARFKSALALSGQSQKDWAEQHGADIQHLHYLLRDGSAELLRAIDEFIQGVEQRTAPVAA